MTSSIESLTQRITGVPAEEASLYSLDYVAALQECTAHAYQSTLRALTASSGSSGVYGDAFTECVTRVRLETERRIAGQLRTSLLQEQGAAKARGADGKAHASVEMDAEATTTQGGSSGWDPGSASGRRRASSAIAGGVNHVFGKAPRRGSQRPSLGAGQRSSFQAGTLTSRPSSGKVDSKDALNLTGTVTTPAAVPPASSSSSPTTPVGVAVAVRLLRKGLTRSLGWPLPSSTLLADGKSPPQLHQNGSKQEGYGSHSYNAQLRGLADTLLSRRSFSQASPANQQASTPTRSAPSSPPPSTSVPLFMELEDEEGRQDILLEWIEDVLIFALHLDFNAPQAQCLLLDSILVLQVLEDAPEGTDGGDDDGDDVWERRVAVALQDVLCTQTCPTVTRAIETVHKRQPVVREVPDPVQLAEIEQKRLKASTQKALATLDEIQAGIPLVKQTFMEDVSVEVEKDATVPAVFSMAEAAAAVEFLTRSTVMHRRLWQLCLWGAGGRDGCKDTSRTTGKSQLRPIMAVPLCAYVEDVTPIFVPPLSAFYPSMLQAEVNAQRSLLNACAAEKTSLFAAKYVLPLAALHTKEAAERQKLLTAARQAAAEDRDVALTSQECAQVEKAFRLRLEDTVSLNARVSRSGDGAAVQASQGRGKRQVEATTTAASAAASTSVPVMLGSGSAEPHTKSDSVGTSAAGSGTKYSMCTSKLLGQPMLLGTTADLVTPPEVVFSLADVERRVERVAAAAENLPSGGAASTAVRGGQRKR
jgi:hypothetical protein